MAEYIERGSIEYPYMSMSMWGINSATCKAYNEGVKATEDAIKVMHTADVVEVRHGKWLPSRNGINPIRCDKCNMPALFVQEQDGFGGFGFYRHPSNYCPNCGAKMGGKGEGE